MWNLTGKSHLQCEGIRDALERTAAADSPGRVDARLELLAQLSEAQRLHLNACEECGVFAHELLEARRLLHAEISGPQPGPFFLARVMATIADREARLQERESQTWAAVPRLAYRLSVVASLALLIAGGWLYQRPRPQANFVSAADQHVESLVDGGTPAPDDALLNLAD